MSGASVSDDTLFAYIERLHGEAPWGRVLDAGTGRKSLEWVAHLDTRHWTAVTGSDLSARELDADLRRLKRPGDRILHANWTDPTLLFGETFDVVLADYLLGAISGFAPFFQDRLFARLLPLVGSRLYAVGLAPYPEKATHPWAEILLEIVRLRDACILLAGHRVYQEYPVDWVIRSLESSGYIVDEVESFPICYGPRFVKSQLAIAERQLLNVVDRDLAQQLDQSVAELRERALACHAAGGAQPFGEDWVVLARPREPLA